MAPVPPRSVGKPRRRVAQEPPPTALRVLVVDDDPSPGGLVGRILVENGHRVVVASNAADAAALVDEAVCDLLISDPCMPGTDGLSLMRHVRDNHPDVRIIAMTACPSIATAVDATRLGADAYLEKPLAPAVLVDAVTACARKVAAQRLAMAGSQNDIGDGGAASRLIGESAPMQEIHRMIPKIAASDATVLLQGESGTGKGLVAKMIHEASPRSSGPFVKINCAELSPSLLESELFGHVRGAFTGADRKHEGLFVSARGGTIFLDEINEMARESQAKLLRVLEDHRVRPVGGTGLVQVDVQVLTATNRNLAEAVAANEFPRDLYYRIRVLHIGMPPLRDRGDDILLLVRYFNHHFAEKYDQRPLSFTDSAIQVLLAYDWPGNVRQLKHTVEELVLTCERDHIDASDLPEETHYRVPMESSWKRTLKEVDDAHIQRVLARLDGNRREAAKILGVATRTLRRWLNEEEET